VGLKRRAAALHVLKLTHAVKGIAGSNRRPCLLFAEVRFGNRPILIRQRCMRQPRAIGMVLCKARSQQHTFQSRSVSNHQDRHFLHWQHHPADASVDEESQNSGL
jgi:hypothetical protein